MAVVSNGTTIIDAGALGSGVATGSLTLLSTQTASASATISFTSGIDSTYDSYVFKFINIHPASNADFTFNLSTDSGSNYGVTKTTTVIRAYHIEDGSESNLGYVASLDLAQSTAFQILAQPKSENDENYGGTLTLFNPSSTTFVKHFISTTQNVNSPYSEMWNIAGYGNTTSAVNAVQFKMSSGNIDSGVIKLYGIGG